jgi:hypothetical protein
MKHKLRFIIYVKAICVTENLYTIQNVDMIKKYKFIWPIFGYDVYQLRNTVPSTIDIRFTL